MINLVGKRGRGRSIGIPPWVKVALDNWVQASGVRNGRIFRTLNKDGQLAGRVKTKGGGWADGNLTPQAIYGEVIGSREDEFAPLKDIQFRPFASMFP